MKLYGNIKSERATKGQGGNDFLEVEILNANQDIVATIKVLPGSGGKAEITISHDSALADIATGEVNKKCECTDPLCAKCLLLNCQDDECKVHPLAKKMEFREMYKNRK